MLPTSKTEDDAELLKKTSENGWVDAFFSIPHSNVLRKEQYHWSYREVVLYKNHLDLWRYYFRHKIDKMLIDTPQKAPITFLPYENAFTGWKIEYESFDNSPIPKVDGFHDMDNEASIIRIFYAQNLFPSRIRFTIAHELAHVYQRLDPHFRSSMEAIPSSEMRVRLMERLANASASYFLVPEKLLRNEYEIYNTGHWPTEMVLASNFKVSERTIDIALDEYGIIPHRQRATSSTKLR